MGKKFLFVLGYTSCVLLCVLVAGAAISGCSSDSKSASESGPDWTRQPTRTVDGGYIVYIGVGEDAIPERAAFKAEASGIQDIANECSFAPKGTRIEDRFDGVSYGQHKAFAKVAISFDECEQAKQTVDPEKVKLLANVAMTEEVKRYQDLVYNPPQTLSEVPPGGSPYSDNQGANPALASTTPVVMDDGTYFVARQQVAYAKEIVILAPPQAYPPQAPQTQVYLAQVQPTTTRIQQYEVQHPAVRTWNNSWSNYERNPSRPLPASIPHGRSGGMGSNYDNRGMNPALRSGSYRGQPHRGQSRGYGERRNRRRSDEHY